MEAARAGAARPGRWRGFGRSVAQPPPGADPGRAMSPSTAPRRAIPDRKVAAGRASRARRAAGRAGRAGARGAIDARRSSTRTTTSSSSTSRPGSSSIRPPATNRHARQRAHRPLRREPLRHRRGASGPASCTGSTRTRPGCSWSPRPTAPIRRLADAVRRSRPHRPARARPIWRSSGACRTRTAGHDRGGARPQRCTTARRSPSCAGERGRYAITHYARRGDAPPPTAAGGEPRALRARDRAHAPDPRAHGAYRPSAARRPALRLRLQDQGATGSRRSRRAGRSPPSRRQALHAALLGFEHPATRRRRCASRARCPPTWQRCWTRCGS